MMLSRPKPLRMMLSRGQLLLLSSGRCAVSRDGPRWVHPCTGGLVRNRVTGRVMRQAGGVLPKLFRMHRFVRHAAMALGS